MSLAAVSFSRYVVKQSTTAVRILGCFLFGITLSASGQTPHHAPKIPNPGDKILGAELVLWTPMQQPKPLSKPPVAEATPAPEQTSEAVSPKDVSPENAQIRGSISEALVGEVVKTGETYALTTSENETYILDNSNAFQAYEGEVVKIVCEPNPNRNLLHVLSLVPLSVNRTPQE